MPITPGKWVADSSVYRPDRYYRYADLTELLHTWAREYPELVTIESIGQSYERRDIWALTITDRSAGAPEEKPAYFVDANIHAGEVTGVATVLWLINHVLTNAATDEAIKRLLAETTIYAVPAINVDAMDLLLEGGADRVRSSVRPFPHPEQQDGLVVQDVDGDGTTVAMRIRHPNGPWKPSAHDPRIMAKRAPDEFEEDGEYYFVLPEGIIQNWDGGKIDLAPALMGLDANRNFPADWGPHWEQSGAGDFPLSEPETRALAQFLLAHPNIHGSQHFHTFSGVILRPPTRIPTAELPLLDQTIFKLIGAMGEAETGYPCIGIYDDFAYDKKKPLKGGLLDWVYEQLGIIPFSTELWNLATKAGIEVKDFIGFFRERSDEVDAKMLHLLDSELESEGFKEWTPFEHPQLGAVEIGGWNHVFTWQNPPGPWLEEVTSGNARFLLRAMQTAPRLEIHDARAEALGADLYKISVIIENAGFLPTYVSEQGKKVGVNKPVKVTLETADGATVISGEAEHELGHLHGRANQYGALSFGGNWTGGIQSRARVEWVISQPGGGTVTVTAATPKAGKATVEISLE